MTEPVEAPARTIDARGHKCPVPSLMLRRALSECAEGQLVQVTADDPMAKVDIPHLTSSLGYLIVFSDIQDHQVIYQIRKISTSGA